MKEFNLDEALAGKPVVTRNGLKVLELHLFNAGNPKYKLGAIIEGYNEIRSFNLNGRHIDDVPHHLDLFMDEEERYYGFKDGDDCFLLLANRKIKKKKFRYSDPSIAGALLNYCLFKSKEEVEKEIKYRAAKFRLNAKMRELEGDWKADWNDTTQRKYYFVYAQHNKLITEEYDYDKNSYESWRYTNEETIKWVVENMQDDIKIVFGVE